jgi:hypothetical protein
VLDSQRRLGNLSHHAHGERLRRFSVHYTLDGERHNKRFYIDAYGSRAAALAEARQFRKEMEREMWREYLRRNRETGRQAGQHK